MRYLLFSLPVMALLASCSNREVEVQAKERTIMVTGSADAELAPDEVTLTIQIGEYYKEQYDPGVKEKDYKNLVRLDEIEKPIMAILKKHGVADSSVHFSYVSTNWRWYYYEEKKPVHFEKTMSVKFKDFNKAVAVIQEIDTKGVNYLNLGDFHSSKEQQMRKDLKAQALKNAKEKAANMLASVDQELGDVVSVVEVADNSAWSWEPSQSTMSNATYSREESSAAGPQNIRMRYEVQAEFEIE